MNNSASIHQSATAQTGITYIEVLVATLLIAATLVPALQALNAGIEGPAIHRQRAENHYLLLGKLEVTLAEPFSSLDAAATAAGSQLTPTSYSDPAISVFIWRYDLDDADSDGDVFSGGEADMLWLRVAMANGNQSLETLLGKY